VTHTAGHKRLVLLVLVVMGCLAVFALARWMAAQPHVELSWDHAADGHGAIAPPSAAELEATLNAHVVALLGTDGRPVPWPVDAAADSLRWVTSDDTRRQTAAAWAAANAALAHGEVVFDLEGGQQVTARAVPRGYAHLGLGFWLLASYALVLWLVGGLVVLLRPQWRNGVYLVMALAQSAQLAAAAVAAVPALAPPGPMADWGVTLSTSMELITCAALLHAAAVYPRALPGHRLFVATGWLATLAWLMLTLAGVLPHAWWWTQGLVLVMGAAALALLTRTLHQEPHPFVFVMRRIGLLLWATMVLLVLTVALRQNTQGDPLPLIQATDLVWNVFTASVILLVPFLAHSGRLMREVPIVVGTTALAVLANLAFVAVFGLGPLTAMVAALLLAVTTYAAIAQWLLHHAAASRAAATERMFAQLYSVAREVETRPERAGLRMTELLEHVFEPLEARATTAHGKRSQLSSNGAVLLVPMPGLLAGGDEGAMLALRGADRGRRLFSPGDTRLADRIVEQLMRAVAQDRAVERGRSEERMRIAQDLHDDIGARLLTLLYKAPSREMENYVRHTLQDLKTLTRGLAAQSQPLELAAAEWKRDLTDRASLAGCALNWTSTFDREVTLTTVEWSSLTRIVRELVSNVIAHAKASQAHIYLRLEEGQLFISCTDDGQGKDPSTWSRGLGVGGIRKRVRLLGGEVQWREHTPQGIVCDVYIPRLAGCIAPPP